MFKKLICLVLSCFMLGTYAYASENAQSVADSGKVYTLSLEKAIELAMEENPELQAGAIKLASAKVSLDAAKLSKYNSKNAVISVSSGLSVAYVKEGYYIEQCESQIRLCNLANEQTKNKIAYNVTEKYFNCKLAERLVKTSEQSYKLALENKNATDEKLRLGLVSQLEANNASLAVAQRELAKENSVRNLGIAKEDLKISLQLDGEECDLVLTDDIDFVDFESDVNADIGPALESRYDTTALRESQALSKRYLEITAKYATSNTATYNTANSDFIQSDYNMTNRTKQIALSIRNDYNTVLAKKGDLKIAEQNLNLKNQAYEAEKLKYQMGMITNIQLTQAFNDLADCESAVENARLAYKLAVIKYQYNIKIGL